MAKANSTPIEKLFGSKTRAKLLSLFFSDPSKSYYVREITRVIEEQINSVRRELGNLEGIGVIKSETYDNKVYYSANQKHPYAHPFMEIFSKKNDTIVEVEVKRADWSELIKPAKRYLEALVVTRRMPGQDGVDLLIIGNDRTKKLTHWAEIVEKKKGRPLNFVILTPEEYIYRKRMKDRFLADIFEMDISEIIDPNKIIKEK